MELSKGCTELQNNSGPTGSHCCGPTCDETRNAKWTIKQGYYYYYFLTLGINVPEGGLKKIREHEKAGYV